MAPNPRTNKASLKRNGTISSIKNTVRKFSACRGMSQQSDDEARELVLHGMDYNTRHAFYDEYKKEILEKTEKSKMESSDTNHVSVNTAISMNQWRRTPSPKPIRKNWSDLPGTVDHTPVIRKVSRGSRSEEHADPSQNEISRKLSKWHNSVRRGMQRAQTQPLPPATHRPLATQTAERHKLRVKNWTLEDRHNNAWVNPPLSPYPDSISSSASVAEAFNAPSGAEDVSAEPAIGGDSDGVEAKLDLEKSLPPVPASSVNSMYAPEISTVNQESRSSIPRPINRRTRSSRLPLPTAAVKSVKQPKSTPQILWPATPAPGSCKKNSGSVLQDLDNMPTASFNPAGPIRSLGENPSFAQPMMAKSTPASKRMGKVFEPLGLDMRDILDEIASLSPQGDGSRYSIVQSPTAWILDSESSTSSLALGHASGSSTPNGRKRSKSHAQVSNASENQKSPKIETQAPIPAEPCRRRSATLGAQKEPSMISDSSQPSVESRVSTVVIKKDPKEPDVVFSQFVMEGTTELSEGKKYGSSSSFAYWPLGQKPNVFRTRYLDNNSAHAIITGDEEAMKAMIQAADEAGLEISAAKTTLSHSARLSLQKTSPTPPVPAIPALIQNTTSTSARIPKTPARHPTALIPGSGRAQKSAERPTPAQSIHPPSLIPGRQKNPITTPLPRRTRSPVTQYPVGIAKRPRRNIPRTPSPRTSTIADLTPLTLDLPEPQIDMSSVMDSSDAQYSYVEPTQQDFSRPFGARRRASSPRRRLGPHKLRPMARSEIAYEHAFRLES